MSKKVKISLFALVIGIVVNIMAHCVNHLASDGIDALEKKKLDCAETEDERKIIRGKSMLLRLVSSAFCISGMVFIPSGFAKNYADKIGYIPD